MRLTNNMIMRRYMANLNSNLISMNKLNEKVSSGMRFSKMSDDTSAALKAFQVRRNLSRIDLYKNNILYAQNYLTDVESSIQNLNNIVTEVKTRVLQARSGTYGDSDRKVIANTLEDLQKQILDVANSNFSGKFIFGGPNVKQPPFTLDSNGRLLYNGTDVDTGIFTDESIYIDIGLGISTDSSGNVNSQSVFNISNPGSVLLGNGVDADGISNNLYNIVGELAKMFENNDLTNIDKYVNRLNQKSEDIMIQYANTGEKSSFMEFLSSRFDTDENNAMVKQSNLETIDPARGILEFKNQEASYSAALQMGTRVLQPSLMDYLK